VRFKLGDLAGAVTDYDKAIEIRPDYADAYANRGHTRYEQGDLKGAIADVWDSLRLRLKRR
jgi:tetratricopeptide (TPR) repeat protein